MYVDLKQEKFHFADGRRGVRFFIIDSNGKPNLAVVGEERDTRDGHYMYRKQASFPAGTDLCCGNLAGVHKWVKEVMIESGCADSSIDFKPLRRGNTLGGAAEASHHKKQRHLKDEVERLIMQAKEYEQTNMKAFEIHYTSVIKSARSTTKAWLSDVTSREKADAFAAAIQNIKKNAATISGGQSKSSNRDRLCKLVEELQLLRNLSDSHIPLELLDSSHAYAVVDEIESTCTKKSIVALCTQIKEQWRLQLQKHLIVGATSWDECPLHFKPTLAQKRGAMKAFGMDSRQGKKGATFSTMIPGGKGGKYVGLANAPPPVRPRPRSKNGKGSTGIGKGRKICHHCNRIVGSPSRICPYCKGDLPMKKASTAK